MTFGEKLQELRRKAGMSQDALAERIEVSRQAVSKWERDEAMPETEKVIRLAKLFDVSLDELLLDRVDRAAPQVPQANAYGEIKRDVKRHGYKLGYALIVLGVLICVFSLLMWQLWPGIGMGMLMPDSGPGFPNPYAGKSYTIIVGGEERVITDVPQFMIDNAMKEQGVGTNALEGNNILQQALRSQARLFLFGLLPGGVMTAAGVAIVVIGRKRVKAEKNPGT